MNCNGSTDIILVSKIKLFIGTIYQNLIFHPLMTNVMGQLGDEIARSIVIALIHK